jgi:hypothetical protein
VLREQVKEANREIEQLRTQLARLCGQDCSKVPSPDAQQSGNTGTTGTPDGLWRSELGSDDAADPQQISINLNREPPTAGTL